MIYNLIENLYKFPRFLIAVLIGFFLTTFKPLFKSLKNKKNKIIFTITSIITLLIIQLIIKLMTN